MSTSSSSDDSNYGSTPFCFLCRSRTLIMYIHTYVGANVLKYHSFKWYSMVFKHSEYLKFELRFEEPDIYIYYNLTIQI